jgi:hypothetical protein
MLDVGGFLPAVGAGGGFLRGRAQMAGVFRYRTTAFTGVSHNSSSMKYSVIKKIRCKKAVSIAGCRSILPLKQQARGRGKTHYPMPMTGSRPNRLKVISKLIFGVILN